jgi:hypothetical protein
VNHQKSRGSNLFLSGADGVMEKARALVKFFNKSTQASTKLLKIQRNLTDHNEGKAPVGGLLEMLWEYTLDS